jgi:hypothetical protein
MKLVTRTEQEIDPAEIGTALAQDPDAFARMMRAFTEAASRAQSRYSYDEFAKACIPFGLVDPLQTFMRHVGYHDVESRKRRG